MLARRRRFLLLPLLLSSLELSDTKVYEPKIRALLVGADSHNVWLIRGGGGGAPGGGGAAHPGCGRHGAGKGARFSLSLSLTHSLTQSLSLSLTHTHSLTLTLILLGVLTGGSGVVRG